MRVEGLKILDSNYYHQIAIYGNKIVVQRCSKGGKMISRDDGVKTMPPNHSISDEIRNLDKISTVDRIVEYYLDYNRLTSISSELIREEPYIIVEGEKDNSNAIYESNLSKKLKIRTDFPKSKFLVNKILDKYQFDRDEFLAHLIGDVREFSFFVSDNNTSYSLDKGKDGNDTGIFFLNTHKYSGGNFTPPNEIEFLNRALPMIMGDNLVTTTIVRDEEESDFLNPPYVMITPEDAHSVITMPNKLAHFASEFESNYNQSVMKKRRETEKINGKVFQMKMEGF